MQFAFAALVLLVSTSILPGQPQASRSSSNAPAGAAQHHPQNSTVQAGGLPTVTLDAVGDVMLGWGVNAMVQNKGADAPLAGVCSLLGRADATVGNLESPLSDRGKPTKAKSKKDLKARKEFLLRGSPAAAPGLAHCGFAAMTLANNHILDFGADALDDTLQALHDSGIATAGAGGDASIAWQPAYFERRGLRFALLGVSEVIPRGYGAGKTTAGVAPGRDPSSGDVNAAYLRVLAHAIRAAHNSANVVIVYEHWGKELIGAPSTDHVRLAHAAIDAGASLVLGAHPHVLGPVELYRGGLIAYSLGNFVFDTQPGIQTRSAILEISLRGQTVTSWRALPIRLVQGAPKPASGADAALVRALVAGEVLVSPSPSEVVRAAPLANGPGQGGSRPGPHGPPQ